MLKKLFKTYKLHMIVMMGTNLAGLINFAFSLILFKIAPESSFNLYSALSAYLVIISTPGDLIKKLSTGFGNSISSELENLLLRANKQGVVVLTVMIAGLLTWLISTTTDSSFISAALLVCAVFIGLYSALLSGLLQHKQEFVYTSIVAIGQSCLKIGLGLLLFSIIGDDGIWVTLYLTSLLTAFSLKIISSKYNRTHILQNNKVRLNKKDLLTNLFLILVLEILVNIDSIVVLNKLGTQEAYIYNALSLVRKTMLFSLLGFTAIILSESRKREINKIHMLFKNVSITALIGGVIAVLFVILKPLALSYLKLDSSYTMEYYKFIVSSLLFVLLLMSTTWFTALRSYFIRLLMGLIITAFIIIYYFFFQSLSQGITLQIIGILVILCFQVGIISGRIISRR